MTEKLSDAQNLYMDVAAGEVGRCIVTTVTDAMESLIKDSNVPLEITKTIAVQAQIQALAAAVGIITQDMPGDEKGDYVVALVEMMMEEIATATGGTVTNITDEVEAMIDGVDKTQH